MSAKIHFSGGNFDLHTDKAPKTISKKAGTVYQLADCTITHLTAVPEAKEIKEYKADVVILQADKADKIISKLKPKLAIITNAQIYAARELHQKTGVQVISAQDGQIIDLRTYSALSPQKRL